MITSTSLRTCCWLRARLQVMQQSVAGHAMDLLANEIRTSLPPITLRVTNVIGYVILIAVNIAASTGLLGPTNAEISARHPTPLTPAGWAFSIWGIIFALQGLGTVYQAMPQGYTPDGWKQRIVNSVGYGWQIGWFFEVAWQIAFTIDAPASPWICMFLLIGAFLGFAITLLSLFRLKDTCGSLSSVLLYFAFFLPTTLNTAWLSVAAGVGILIVPESYNWDERHVEAFAVVLICLVTALGAIVMQMERDTAYGLTLVWALVAVYGAQSSRAVRITALVCIAVNTLLSTFSLLRRKHPGGGGRGGPSPGTGDAGEPLRQQSASFKRKTDSDQGV
ncbi:hypothetical protein COCOBI_07-6310 [Coccomyxa sp. Obi]|nr:hypothetical protein COCOBI_07-6310 [Coccomyxa sp. Obi]